MGRYINNPNATPGSKRKLQEALKGRYMNSPGCITPGIKCTLDIALQGRNNIPRKRDPQ